MHCVEPRPHPNGERTVISYPDQNVTMIIAYSITSRDVIRTFGSGYETKQAGGGGGGRLQTILVIILTLWGGVRHVTFNFGL